MNILLLVLCHKYEQFILYFPSVITKYMKKGDYESDLLKMCEMVD